MYEFMRGDKNSENTLRGEGRGEGEGERRKANEVYRLFVQSFQ